MTDNPASQRIQDEIDANDVVLFMKGNPVFPQCGFSAAVVQVLSEIGTKFKGIDVLEDPACARASRNSATGRPTRSFTSKANSSAAATSCVKCTRPASCSS